MFLVRYSHLVGHVARESARQLTSIEELDPAACHPWTREVSRVVCEQDVRVS